MAENWIKIEVTTPDKPEVARMAKRLKVEPDAVTGKLVRVWAWADQHTLPGQELDAVELEIIDRITNLKGFAQAMMAAGWLVESGEGWVFPSFDRHNGAGCKTRAVIGRRVQKHRACNGGSVTNVTVGALPKDGKCNGGSVTKALPEGEGDKNKTASCNPKVPLAIGGLDPVDIAALYPRRERMAEAVIEIARQIKAGAEAAAMEAGTRACAAVILTLPGGAMNKFVPGALAFFRDKRWADDPRTLGRQAAGVIGKPAEKLDLGGREAARIINISDSGEIS
ncbi:MAG: hypothetical protein WCK77_20440 [Verrucomicrobiota bacterium]